MENRPPMFQDEFDEFGKGMTKEQKKTLAVNLWVSINDAKNAQAKNAQAKNALEQGKVE